MGGPVVKDAHIEARITVKKTGDPTKRSKVRVYTLDGSAKAGKGYQPMTKVRRTFSVCETCFRYLQHKGYK